MKKKDNVVTLPFVELEHKGEPMNDFLKELLEFREELRLWELKQDALSRRVDKLEQDNKTNFNEEFKKLMEK